TAPHTSRRLLALEAGEKGPVVQRVAAPACAIQPVEELRVCPRRRVRVANLLPIGKVLVGEYVLRGYSLTRFRMLETTEGHPAHAMRRCVRSSADGHATEHHHSQRAGEPPNEPGPCYPIIDIRHCGASVLVADR